MQHHDKVNTVIDELALGLCHRCSIRELQAVSLPTLRSLCSLNKSLAMELCPIAPDRWPRGMAKWSACDPVSCLLVFLHVPKASGSSVKLLLKQWNRMMPGY